MSKKILTREEFLKIHPPKAPLYRVQPNTPPDHQAVVEFWTGEQWVNFAHVDNEEDAKITVRALNFSEELGVALNGLLVAIKLAPHVDVASALFYAEDLVERMKR